MDIKDLIRWEGLNHITVLEALASFDNLDNEDQELIMPILPQDEALRILNASLKAVEEGVANFLSAFPSTRKQHHFDKKIILSYFSPKLTELMDEFRLPSFFEEKLSEGKVVEKAWEHFRGIYIQTAATLVKVIKGSQWPADMSCLLNPKVGGDEIRQLSLGVMWTTTRLLLVGLLAKKVYGLVMARLHLESRYDVYCQAFKALKTYKISSGLKIVERGARISPELREEAMALLTKELKCHQGLEERWVRESEMWNDDSEVIAYPNSIVNINYIDWALGVNHLETILPEATMAANGLLGDLLDFLPKIESMKGEFSNLENEAEVILDNFYEQMSQMKHGLMEPETTTLNPAKKNLNIPKNMSSAFQLHMGISLLTHEATSLNVELCELTEIYNKLEGTYREDTIQMLKVKLEAIRRKKESMKLHPENVQEVAKVYTMMDTIDKKTSNLETFISLEEEKAKSTVKAREVMIQRQGKGRNLGSTRRLSKRCAFKNCNSVNHFTRRCDKNLKPGNVPVDIQHMMQEANLCLRCMRERNWEGHQGSCVGSYRMPNSGGKLVKTDCNTCTATLPSGEIICLNRRVCHHTIERIRSEKKSQRRGDPSCFTRSLETKRIKELKEEKDMGDEGAIPLCGARIPNHTSIKFENELRGASLVEDHQTDEKGRSIHQLSGKNTTTGPESEMGIDTPPYHKIEPTLQGDLDWASEIVVEGNKQT